jgi:ATP-binding cassette, subfamily B, bacterial
MLGAAVPPFAAAGRPPLASGALSFLWHYVKARPAAFLGAAAMILGAAGCAVAVQYAMKLIVDAMAAGDHSAVWWSLGLFLGLIAGENVLWRIGGWMACHVIVDTGARIRLDLFEHLCGHPAQYFAGNLAGALGGRLTGTAGSFGSIATALMWKIAPPVVDFIGAIVIFAIIDSATAAALVAAAGVAAVAVGRFGGRGKPLHMAYAEEANQVGGDLIDTVANVWAVMAFSARGRELRRLEQRFHRETAAQKRSWLYLEKTRALHDGALCVLAGAMLGWVILLWTRGAVTPGDVVVVSALTFRILHGSRDVAFALVGTTQDLAQIGETLRVIGREHAITEAPDAIAASSGAGDIVIDHLRFAYPDGHEVFRDLCLHIPAGQRLGVIGPSGAGKSTLIKLLLRFEEPQSGRISIDGRDIRLMTLDSLRNLIAVVPQELALFHRTIGENIRYGRPDATDEELVKAGELAQCGSFVTSLPDGYGTPVGDRGASLSGGQRQRVAIARAILRHSSILILDEATSALDRRSESAVRLALAEVMRERTVIAIAHDLESLAGFDRLIELDAGGIVRDGFYGDFVPRPGAANNSARSHNVPRP